MLRAVQALLGMIAILSSAIVASRVIAASSNAGSWLALTAAVAVGILGSLNLEQKSNGMTSAWRQLNAAVIRFESDGNYDVEKLVKAYEDAEKMIGDVKVSTK